MRNLVFAALVLAMTVPTAVHGHDWYSNIRNPQSGVDCCGGSDCQAVDVNRIQETQDEFILDQRWHFRKDEAMPSFDGGYHACIWGGKPRCFFVPSNV